MAFNMNFGFILFFINVGILRFTDEEVPLETLSVTQQRFYIHEKVIRQNDSL